MQAEAEETGPTPNIPHSTSISVAAANGCQEFRSRLPNLANASLPKKF
jgi:hypothetical protein